MNLLKPYVAHEVTKSGLLGDHVCPTLMVDSVLSDPSDADGSLDSERDIEMPVFLSCVAD